MAQGIYVGVNGAPKKVKEMYVGVDGTPRKVKEGYVGVGGVPKMFYSAKPPLFNWEIVVDDSDFHPTSICYGNNKFVAVSGMGERYPKIGYSNNGIDWNFVEPPIELVVWQSVVYGNNKFVAVGYFSVSDPGTRGGYVMYSSDGITWKMADENGGRTCPEMLDRVTYGNNKFVAISSDDCSIFYSVDGIAWTKCETKSQSPWTDIIYGGSKFVAVSGGSANKAAYSDDGISWEEADLPKSNYWSRLCFGDGKYIAISNGTGNRISCSYDGNDWTGLPVDVGTPRFQHVIYTKNMFICLLYNFTTRKNILLYSKDGTIWESERSIPIDSQMIWMAVGNNKLLACSMQGGKIICADVSGLPS